MGQVNMPEKKDNMGQGMQIFQMAKSIYDMKDGKPPADAASSSAATTAMQRRYVAGKATA